VVSFLLFIGHFPTTKRPQAILRGGTCPAIDSPRTGTSQAAFKGNSALHSHHFTHKKFGRFYFSDSKRFSIVYHFHVTSVTPTKSTGKTPQKTPSSGKAANKNGEKVNCGRCIAAFVLTVVALIAVVVILHSTEIIDNKGTILIFVIVALMGVIAEFSRKTFWSGCGAKAKKE
jgi:hypothetical protein